MSLRLKKLRSFINNLVKGKYTYWPQFFLINLGIRLLPEELRTEMLIRNCMITGHIKVKLNGM